MAVGRDKVIAFDPPGAIGLPSDGAVVMLRFDEPEPEVFSKDESGSLQDLGAIPGTATPDLVDGATGRARRFDPPSGSGMASADADPGASLLTRDCTIQAILSWSAADQDASGETGTVVCRGMGTAGTPAEYISYCIEIDTVSSPSGIGEVRWFWQTVAGAPRSQVGAQFAIGPHPAAPGFTMLTATRRWISPSEVLLRYYCGDVMIGEVTTVDGDIGGGTTGMFQVGFRHNAFDVPARFLAGSIDELAVYDREMTLQEIESTWLRITVYQPRGYQLMREMHPRGFPLPTDPASDVQLDLRMTGNALGYAAALTENVREYIMPQRAFGSVLEDWEETVRVTPEPRQDVDTRRARVLAKIRQRRGSSLDGFREALVGLIDADVADLEFLAFDNTVRDDFTTLEIERWDTTPVGSFVLNAGAARCSTGAGTFIMDGATKDWRTLRQSIGGNGKLAHHIAKLVFVTPQANAEAGLYFANECTGDYILVGLRDVAGSYRVFTEVISGGVSAGAVQQAVIGANPAAIWFHLYQRELISPTTAAWRAAWSTTSGVAGFSETGNITHATECHWSGMYVRTVTPIGAGAVADFDDSVVRTPFGTRPFNAYVFLDAAGLGADPDVDGAHDVVIAIKHAFVNGAFITSKSLLCDSELAGCDTTPCGAI